MIKKDSIKSFILGVMTYFVLSVILELINLDNYLIKAVVFVAVLLVSIIIHYLLKKRM